MLADLVPLLCLHLLLLLSCQFLQETDVVVGARSMLLHQRGRVLDGSRVLRLVLVLGWRRLIEHRCVVAQLAGPMLNFGRMTLRSKLVMLATVQLLVSLHHLISLQFKLELLEAHVLLRIVGSAVAGAVILISLQHLLLEPFIHLLHQLFAAFTSFKRLVSHGRPR